MNRIVARNTKRQRRRGVYVSPLAHVVRANVLGETVFFTVTDPKDEIQQYHARGEFYESEELEILSRHFPHGGRFCDIGANLGNHSIFLAKFKQASRIVLIEPNPEAIELLESNIHLNGLWSVCERGHLGIGLSDGAAENAWLRVPKGNLGGARIKEGKGDVPMAVGDVVFKDENFDLIKIDVEGFEIKVLSGMENIFRSSRPKMFIEVNRNNDEAFHSWCKAFGYCEVERFQRYPSNINYMVAPE